MNKTMEEKREQQEECKHVCRLCNKKYPSGKSLGGHMRSHVIANSYVPLHKLKSKKSLTFCNNNGNQLKSKIVKNVLAADAGDSSSSASSGGGCGGVGGSTGFGENSKKKFRVMDSTVTVKQEFKDLTMESHSDDEVGLHDYDKRSAKEARYRAVALIDSFSLENGYSSNKSEIEIEQEQLALCLMMLSRDSSHRIGSLPEPSTNNSVILEVRSSSTYVPKRKYLNCEINNNDNADGFWGMEKKVAKLNCAEMDSSDSGYFENGAKEVESDDSVDGYARNYGIKNSKAGFGCDVHESELGKRSKNSGRYYSEKTSCTVEEGGEVGNQAQLKKYMKSKAVVFSKKMKNDHLSSPLAPLKNSQKASKYKCSICRRSFKTHQALGGHIITHRSRKDLKAGFRNCKNGVKASEGHCCPFCDKVFKSGQALGGHKRSHLTGCSGQDKTNQVKVKSVDESPPENHHLLIDLNLPPSPVEEDSEDNRGRE